MVQLALMPEQDIYNLIQIAVLNGTFKEELVNPETRMATLDKIRQEKSVLGHNINLTEEEASKLKEIKANKLSSFIYTCYKAGLLTLRKS